MIYSIQIYPQNIEMQIGEWFESVSAKTYPSEHNNAVRFMSSNTDVAVVDPLTGKVYAVGKGKTTIVATAKNENELSAECNLVVTGRDPIPHLNVNPQSVIITEGQFQKVEACIVLDDSSKNDAILWGSTNTNIVAINEKTGHIFGVNSGKAAIFAFSKNTGKIFGKSIVTVKPKVVISSVEVFPYFRQIDFGEPFRFFANYLPENTTEKVLFWLSTNESVATVNHMTGEVTAVAPGVTMIRAYAEYPNIYGESMVWVNEYSCTQDEPCDCMEME